MAADLFDFAAERLEHHTSLDRLEARGTLRIALKLAGLTAKSVTAGQLCVVLEKIMPDELEKRDVNDAAAACSAVIGSISVTKIVAPSPANACTHPLPTSP